MKKRFVFMIMALAVAGLTAGCAGRPLTPEEKIFRLEKNVCEAEADAMIGLRFYRPLAWKEYFERCMKLKGFTEEELRDMWY